MPDRPANHIRYEAVYSRDYGGHHPGARSFPLSSVPSFAALIRKLGCEAAVDLGAGNGELVSALRAEGLAAVGFDFRAAADAGVYPLDLTTTNQIEIDAALERKESALGNRRYLTFCLDVLEHLDPADVGCALRNLHKFTFDYLLCSISTRPSSDYNLYHATVLPTSIWRQVFLISGFEEVRTDSTIGLGANLQYPASDSLWIVHQWRATDPFREALKPEPNYLLFRKQGVDNVAASAQTIKEINHLTRARIRSCPVEINDAVVVHFLVGHPQNFSLYEPYWDCLPADQVSVWLRQGVERNIENHRFQLLRSWLKCRGISHRIVRSTDDVVWRELGASSGILLSASESTADDGHLQNLAFVAQARIHGFLTALLQHGIWSEDFRWPITFLSSLVLAWSPEHEESFRQLARGSSLGPDVPRGFPDVSSFIVTGCPKFDAYFQPSGREIFNLLGDWTSVFRKVVLVTTNLAWVRTTTPASQFYTLLAELASSRQECLFVLKLHPGEDLDPKRALSLPPNVVVLTDPVCWSAGIRTSDLILASDMIVSTVSTIALEAALAGKPFFLLDTGTGIRYEHAPTPKTFKEAETFIDRTHALTSPSSSRAFRDHYHAQFTNGHALERSLRILMTERLALRPSAANLSPLVTVAAALGSLTTRLSAQLLAQREGA